MRHRIRYSDVTWRKQLTMPLVFVAIAVGFAIFRLYSQHGQFTSEVAIWLLYIPAGLIYIGVLHVNRIRSYVEAGENGILVQRLLRSTLIPYENVRSIRVQELSNAFQDRRKRMVTQIVRPLLKEPALYLRLRGDEQALAAIAKSLGVRAAYDGTAVFPIAEVDRAVEEITPHVSIMAAANLGGGRRRKRRH